MLLEFQNLFGLLQFLFTFHTLFSRMEKAISPIIVEFLILYSSHEQERCSDVYDIQQGITHFYDEEDGNSSSSTHE